jgi:hypothetical protein
MKVAYADPPYLGCGKKHYGKLHANAEEYDRPEAHRQLIERLCHEFDAWALSTHTPALRILLPWCPPDVRVGAWVKPFASFKAGVAFAFAWEAVLFHGGRKRTRDQSTVRDFVSEPIAMCRGYPGVKPDAVCFWIFDALNLHPDDELHDLFPGSGAVSRAWQLWRRRFEPPEQFQLEEVAVAADDRPNRDSGEREEW